MANIAGIGALVIYANEPITLADWYTNKFGFAFQRNPKDNCHYGELRDTSTGATIFLGIYPAKQQLPQGNRAVMINYKLVNFDSFVAKLEKSGVKIESRRADGASKFATISDPEGNPIELWSGV
ncbi:MAG TPA: VOC family protein [Planctomycetota bacterium]|nr:VOC family protein [Planctomycetota bacterium]